MATHAQLQAIFDRYDDESRLRAPIEELLKALAPAERAAWLWEAFQTDVPDIASAGLWVWQQMIPAERPWSAEEAWLLVEAIAAAFPGGRLPGRGRYVWDDRSLPGWLIVLPWLCDPLIDDPGFRALATARWSALPGEYSAAVGMYLAHKGVIALDALPPEALERAARAALRARASNWQGYVPWSNDQWNAALERALADPGARVADRSCWKALVPLLPAALAVTLHERLEERLSGSADQELALVLAQLDEAALEAGALRWGQPGRITDGPSAFKAAPVVWAWLERLRQRGAQLPVEGELVFKALVDHMVIGWSGGGYDTYCHWLADLVSATVEPARLEPLLLGASRFFWQLAAAAPTRAVIERGVAALGALDYHYRAPAHVTFRHWGAAAAAPLSAALVAGSLERPGEAIGFLQQAGGPDAIPGLIVGLDHKDEYVRLAVARSLAESCPAELVVPALAPLFGFSASPGAPAPKPARKEPRHGAAATLAALPPSAAAHDLAVRALEREKVKDIAQILSQVKTPDAAPSAGGLDPAAIAEAIRSSEGAAWERFRGAPVAVVEGFVEPLREVLTAWGRFREELPLCLSYQAALSALGEEPGVGEAALSVVFGLQRSAASMYLDWVLTFRPQLATELWASLGSGELDRAAKSSGYAFDSGDASYWLLQNGGALAQEVALAGMKHKSKRVQGFCARWLLDHADASTGPALLPLLREKKEDHCKLAVETLGELGWAGAIEPLEQELARRYTVPIVKAIQAALQRLRSLTFDPAAFPATAEGDMLLDATLAGQASATSSSAPPPVRLRWRASGAPLSPGAQRWLMEAIWQESLERRSEALRAVRARICDEECPALYDALLAGAFARIERDRGVGLYACATLGGPAHVEALGADLERLASSAKTAWGSDGVEVMARLGTPDAIRWLDHWARRSKRAALRERASAGLIRMAAERGVEREELIDSALPDFGFDAHGAQPLDYGPRTLRLLLGDDGSLSVEDETGKVHASPPKARAADDAAKVKAAHARVKALRKDIAEVFKEQAARLEIALACGRRWSAPTWRARFVEHPVVRLLAARLVWEHIDDKGARRPFVSAPGGGLLDAEGAPFALAERGAVHLFHPIEGPEHTGALRARLKQLGVEPLFQQLDRDVYAPGELRPDGHLFAAELASTSERNLLDAAALLGWERGGRESAGLIYSFHRAFGPFAVTVHTTGISPEIPDPYEISTEVRSLSLALKGERAAWSEVPPRITSEVIRDVRRMTGTFG